MEWIIAIIFLIILLFVLTHLRPLSDNETIQLSTKRRNKSIKKYFSFDSKEYNVNKEFKSKMKSDGKFYDVNINLYKFPSTAAALLKYKKHEWILVGFEKSQNIFYMWANKGSDRKKVSLNLPFDEIMTIGSQENASSIMIFHNHPNINPYYYDTSRPSDQDVQSARNLSDTCIQHGINLLEFVCERGAHNRYFSSYSDKFYPLGDIVAGVKNSNNISKIGNLSLHIERIF